MASNRFARESEVDGDRKIRLADIESQVRSLTGGAQEAITKGGTNALIGGVAGVAALVAGAYLHGRRRGRKRASVLEIRRI
jgi:hypothetical protein